MGKNPASKTISTLPEKILYASLEEYISGFLAMFAEVDIIGSSNFFSNFRAIGFDVILKAKSGPIHSGQISFRLDIIVVGSLERVSSLSSLVTFPYFSACLMLEHRTKYPVAFTRFLILVIFSTDSLLNGLHPIP